jgi:polar amino acid transport system substrate-binding protein
MEIWPRMLLAVLVAWPVLAVQTVVLRGDDSYPPYSWVEQGRFKGIYVDLLTAAGRQLTDFRLVLEPVPWKRGLLDLEQGRLFGLFPPYARAERRYIARYSVPLGVERVVIVCRHEVMQRPRRNWPDDFLDVRIGVNAGFALSDRFVAERQAGRIRVDETKGTEDNLLRLASGQIDCYANDELSVRWTHRQLLKRPGVDGPLRHLSLRTAFVLASEPAYVGYGEDDSLSPQARTAFQAQLDRALQQVIRSGEAQRIVDRYRH